MEEQIKLDNLFRGYLLGDLTSAECDRIELAYLKEQDVLDQLLAVEDDLLDEYLSNELEPEERRKFELHLLRTPRQHERLTNAQLLVQTIELRQAHAPKMDNGLVAQVGTWLDRVVQKRVLAFAILLLLVFAVWVAIRNRQMNGRLQVLEAERAHLIEEQGRLSEKLSDVAQQNTISNQNALQIAEESNKNISTQNRNRNLTRIATFVLPVATMRGSSGSSFRIDPDMREVQLQAPIQNPEYKSYEADLQTADGQSLSKWKKLKSVQGANGAAILIKIPASKLRGRNYVLRVSGITAEGRIEDAGFYTFEIKHY
jgi:hypothetical protein